MELGVLRSWNFRILALESKYSHHDLRNPGALEAEYVRSGMDFW